MKPTPSVFTIASGVPFVDALAAGILSRHGDDPAALAGVTVLLPTRRACRALRDAFLRNSGGRPTLLPAMRPLGDVEEDELVLAVADQAWEGDDADSALNLAPALSPLRRRLLLAQLIRRRDPGTPADQALFLAAELARLLDQMQIEEVPFAALENIVPADIADHWRKVLTFLHILSDHWPRILESERALDPAARRSKLLDAQAALWAARPPAGPVVAAGSTGTVPATARLLRVVGALPQGCVVLPGLDTTMPEATWDQIDWTHPQFAMKQLLNVLGVARSGVDGWPAPEARSPRDSLGRTRLLSEALKPTPAWAEPSLIALPAGATAGLMRIDCTGPEEEARSIALAMREALETPGRTAALVTPDRSLARRVAAELSRWHIGIDDSAGVPLALTPVGTFLRLTAAMVAEDAAPIPLLAALKHPLAAGGLRPAAFRARTRRLERALLRGPRPAPRFEGLLRALAALPPERARDAEVLREWLAPIVAAAAPLGAALNAGVADLGEVVRAHVRFAEALAAAAPEARYSRVTPEGHGSGVWRLWSRDDGEAAALWIEELLRVCAARGAPDFASKHYQMVLTELMAGVVVRPAYPRHPRLHIWGPLEARLQQADLLILGGLNEGTWPSEVATDAWMSRPMRAMVGLPAPERRIGLAAHDFAQAASAPAVLLTRATKVEGAPTVPSRWLTRLDAILTGAGVALAPPPWVDWQQALQQPDTVQPLLPPEPRPPAEARPVKLSATRIETLIRDPYAVYARHVLRLRKLDDIDEDPGAKERGTIIHDAIDRFLKQAIDPSAPDALARLRAAGEAAFGELLDRPGVWAFWWPRFLRAAAWFLANEVDRGKVAVLVCSEIQGELVLPGRRPMTITAKADRLDRMRGGGIAVVDYKTGQKPPFNEIKAGFSPQLAIEAVLAEGGAFPGIAPERVVELAYWRLNGLNLGGAVELLGRSESVEALVQNARNGLSVLLGAFGDPATPYRSRPRPDFGPRFSDYDHLARVREWSAGPGKDEAPP